MDHGRRDWTGKEQKEGTTLTPNATQVYLVGFNFLISEKKKKKLSTFSANLVLVLLLFQTFSRNIQK